VSRPFRFGVHVWGLEGDWRARAARYEALGFSTITFTDHLVVPQWEPMAGAAAIAAVTRRIHVGPLVLDTALRNPVLVAKSAATVQRLSGGRLELGLGAGYVAANFATAGLSFAPAASRVRRLEESLQLMRRLWTEPKTSFDGEFFQVEDAPMVAAEPVRPRVVIGGGGRVVMRMAGRMADVASVLARQTSGEWSVAESLADSTEERMVEKAAWVREGVERAGRSPDEVELNTMMAKVIVGDGVEGRLRAEASATGVETAALRESALYLCGGAAEVCDRLTRWRDRVGLSYFSLFDPGDEQLEYLAEHVVAPLAGRYRRGSARAAARLAAQVASAGIRPALRPPGSRPDPPRSTS